MLMDYCGAVNQRLNFTQELRLVYITMCSINGTLGILSSAANLLVIISITRKTSTLRAPSYILLCALAVSDLSIGLAAQPLYIARKVAELQGTNKALYCHLSLAYNSISSFTGALSYLSIATISCDRFLAVYLRTSYRIIITRKTAKLAVLAISALSVLYALSYTLWYTVFYFVTLIFLPLCLVVTCFNYANISRILRQQHQRIKRTNSCILSSGRGEQRDEAVRATQRYKYILKTVLLVLLIFLICYTPYFCVILFRRSLGAGPALYRANEITITIVYLNALLNPVLYFYRIAEIHRAVKETLHFVNN